ncbi:MAG: oxidoreductase [Rhodospirillaceae bacterium]|nr:oxidoreductase [Rhodospirillaceae bacterium]
MITADLSGKRALVTGASSGIGKAVATLLARCGATVAVNHLLDDKRGQEVVETINKEGYQAIAAPGNVSGSQSADDMVSNSIDALGGLDILINNAGTAATLEPIPFEDLDAITEERWQQIIYTNVIGPFRCSRKASGALKLSKGCIINTASIAGIGNAGSSIAYSNSKAAIISQTRCLARALAPDIRVNAVAPGLTRTAWTEPWKEESKKASIESSLLKRMVEPEEVAQGMLFLAVNPAMTGQTIVIDNGRLPT